MRTWGKFSVAVALLVVLCGLPGAVGTSRGASAEGLTKEQGDAILKELRHVRRLLQRMERQGRAPARARRRAPPPATATVSVKGRPFLGDPAAPVTLVEFTDYQCPFCGRFTKNTLPQLKKNYIDTGKVRLVVKDLPLGFHPHARKAAQAAHCADEQGAFWSMHDVLFDNGRKLQAENLPTYAAAASLDVARFKDCLASDRYLDGIDADSREARANKLTGTPTFVLGRVGADGKVSGTVIRGAQPYQVFKDRIDALLKRPAPG